MATTIVAHQFIKQLYTKKILKIRKHCFRILQDDHESDYNALLEETSKTMMDVKSLRTFADFMKNIFKSKSNATIRPFDIIVNARKTTKFGNNSLIGHGPKIWNQLPTETKSETFFLRFKEYLKTYCRLECKCNVCRTFI